ncbi:MAG: vanomycin resistance protein VanB [Clostridium sp.]|jgi:vancomycin resistance protein YoaR|nr:vanomycin resistance protein VanB [Clostridium sp.]
MTDTVVQKKNFNSKARIILISLLILLAILLVVSSFAIYFTLSYDKTHNGIFINDIDVGKMSYEDICNYLNSNYTGKLEDTKVVLKKGDITEEFSLLQLNVQYDIEDAAEKALEVGRNGNVFQRLSNIIRTKLNGLNIDLSYSFDANSVNNIIESFYSKTLIPVKETDVSIEESKVILQTGHPGESIDTEKAHEIVENSIKTCTGGTFDIPSVTIMPKSIDADEIYNKIVCEPSNAKATVEDNKVVVIPHVPGRKIDKSELLSLIDKHQDETDTQIILPVAFEEPEIKADEVNSLLFRDKLASATTHFSTSGQNNYNRGINISISASKINGTILEPGGVFSFNDVVGPRTVQNGYKTAKEYVAGKIVDGIGGGVCQVSSTLYNAVLFSDLETVYRKNHMFSVGYLPLGRDAAVSYNDLDFKFKNNTNWPIKIEANVKNNAITFTIHGTQEQPGKTVELSHVHISSNPAPVEYINDPNLEEGQTVVIQSGHSGYVVDTYKTIKIDGTVVSKTKLHRSTYSPYKTIIKRGTKKATPSEPVPQPTSKPANEVVDETLFQ